MVLHVKYFCIPKQCRLILLDAPSKKAELDRWWLDHHLQRWWARITHQLKKIWTDSLMRLRWIWNALLKKNSGAFATGIQMSSMMMSAQRKKTKSCCSMTWNKQEFDNDEESLFCWNKSKEDLLIEFGKIRCKMGALILPAGYLAWSNAGEGLFWWNYWQNKQFDNECYWECFWYRFENMDTTGQASDQRIVFFLDEFQFLFGTHAGYDFLLFSLLLQYMALSETSKSASCSCRNRHDL